MFQSLRMNWPWLFIPAAICMLLLLFGAVCAVAAMVLMRRSKARRTAQRGNGVPPLIGSEAEPVAVTPRRVLWGKCLLAFAVVPLLAGAGGLLATRFSFGWSSPVPAEWSDGQSPALEPLIRQHCVPFLKQGKSVGMTVAVVAHTNAMIMTFGRSAMSCGAATRADSIFEIGSITKTFTGLALAREIEHGTVRLDQPIQELLPPNCELSEAARAITLRHLTTHASGFPRMPSGASPLTGISMMLFGSDPYAGYTKEDLMADVSGVELEFPPGTKCSYSNFGMTLLGQLLASRTGSRYEDLIRQDITVPLGLTDTTVKLNADQRRRLAQGYRAVLRCGPLLLGLRSSPWFTDNELGGAGALRSTATDMLKYLRANLQSEGQPLEHALRESHRELARENETTAFGMNWVRSQNQTLKQIVIWHNGGTGGFRSFMGFTEDRQAGVVILSNTTESVDDLAMALLRDLADRARQHKAGGTEPRG